MPNLQAHLIEFREHLEAFYDALRLAPPYNTIEKALTAFASEFQSKTQQEQEKIHLDESLKQRLYYDAFVVSGLYKKHRGIIAGLLKSPDPPTIAKKYQYLLQPFRK